jgi:hypothetical protein
MGGAQAIKVWEPVMWMNRDTRIRNGGRISCLKEHKWLKIGGEFQYFIHDFWLTP